MKKPLEFHKGKPCILDSAKFCQENDCENCVIKYNRECQDLIDDINSMVKEAIK